MNSDVVIRQPLIGEYDRIADLWFSSWLSTGLGHTSNVTRDDLRQRLENEAEWELLVAVTGGQVSGMLAIISSSSKLDQLFVQPEHQRQGIGRRLMKVAKERLPHGMWLKAHRLNLNALRFYRSEGFEPDMDRSDSDCAPDDVFFKWVPSN